MTFTNSRQPNDPPCLSSSLLNLFTRTLDYFVLFVNNSTLYWTDDWSRTQVSRSISTFITSCYVFITSQTLAYQHLGQPSLDKLRLLVPSLSKHNIAARSSSKAKYRAMEGTTCELP
ncbi:hypothetical protein CR513_55778, partial [Mucuna pruriens]